MKVEKNTELKKIISVLRQNEGMSVEMLAIKLNTKKLRLLAKLNLKQAQLNSKDYALLQKFKPMTNEAIRTRSDDKSIQKRQRYLQKNRHQNDPLLASLATANDDITQRRFEKHSIEQANQVL
jgi:hypothetical protein